MYTDKVFRAKDMRAELELLEKPDYRAQSMWYKVFSYMHVNLSFYEFSSYTDSLFSEDDPEIVHKYHFEYPITMLSLLAFKNESQIIQLVEASNFKSLIAPQRAFANLNCLSLYV